jgi:hypothetical protein
MHASFFWTARILRAHEARETRAVRKNMSGPGGPPGACECAESGKSMNPSKRELL